MLNKFVSKKSEFEFNDRKFVTYDEALIPLLLGKTGNQTAINTAGSAWKKIIRRYETEMQGASEYRNPKYDELLTVLKGHLSPTSDHFNYLDNFREINVKALRESTLRSDKVLLGQFTGFREIMVTNLLKFKNNVTFRNAVTQQICGNNLGLKTGIPVDFTYILLCLYIASKYSYFSRNQYVKFISPIFGSKEEYLKRYYEALLDTSFKTIRNLTCFCYTQYYWFDYRLSDSNYSAIHQILFGMFEELDLYPSTEISLVDVASDESVSVQEKQEDKDFVYPDATAISSEFIDLQINPKESIKATEVSKYPSRTKVIDFDKEHRRNRKLGDQGELLVYFKEKQLLGDNGRHDLSERVMLISKQDVTAGFDILSFELNGRRKFIEVKATSSKPASAYFHLSANEYNKAKELDNYYIYVVFEAKTTNPKIWRIPNPLQFENKGLIIVPSEYRVTIKIK